MKRTVEKTVLGGFVSVLALLATVGIVSQRTIAGLIDDSRWVSHTHVVLDLLQRISFQVTQAEASVRGYVITANQGLEAQYLENKSNVPVLVADLRDKTSDNPREQSSIDLLDSLLRDRFATMDEGIQARKAGGLDAVLALSKNSRGLALATEISKLIGQMRSEEERLLVERNTRAQRSSRRAFTTALLAVLLATIAVGASVFLVFRDLTRRREVDRLKTEFVSVVSHELRTPLTSIHGSLGLLASGMLGSTSDQGKRMLDIAVNNTDRLIRLVNDILDAEKLESGSAEIHPIHCDAGELVRNAWEVMRAMAQKHEVTLYIIGSGGTIVADPDRIVQCLTNLISNAIKFSEAGGSIGIRTTPLQDGNLQFEVSDQGRGIPFDQRASIFERFQQVDASDARRKGGTGLGLTICRNIIQQHGGRIWVNSELGKGSTFFFTIPLAKRQNPTAFAAQGESSAFAEPNTQREMDAETHPAD
jgi:signal transduction histidine kinase